jgi:50S ribosomal subunit-associated GTPase HflX
MPIFLRRHWTKRINKIIEERTEYQNQVAEQRKRGKKSKTPTSPIGPPSFAKSKL